MSILLKKVSPFHSGAGQFLEDENLILNQRERLVLSFLGGLLVAGIIFWLTLTQSKVTQTKVSEVPAPRRPYAANKVIPPESSTVPIAKGSTSQYRDEIIQYVIDPCFAQISRKNLKGFMSEKQAVDLLKITDKEAVENVVLVTLPLIKRGYV